MKKIYMHTIFKNVLVLICLSTILIANAQTSKVQFVNNSPDPLMDSVDIYIDGNLTVSGLGFRKATPYLIITDTIPCFIGIAPKHSTDSSQAIFRSSETLTAGMGYYKVISGLVNTSSFPSNPNGLSTAFNVYTYAGARDTSYVLFNGIHPNVDLLYHHGSPDLMKTTMQTFNTVMYISKNDAYGNFHANYAYQTPIDNLDFNLNDANNDTTLLKKTVGNLNKRVGQAGLIFTSGFYTNLISSFNPTNTLTASQKNRILGLFIAWPDGSIDTIQAIIVPASTGVNEVRSLANAYHTQFYPNPASDLLNIYFELQKSSSVVAELFDINGRKISTTNSINKSSGTNQLEMDLGNVSSGIYFCALTIDGQKIVRKISVIK
jgi:Secretion system C-terminal sorting domain